MLRLPYAINILILVPVCWSLAGHRGGGALAAFGGKVADNEALRWMVFSLWAGILLASVAGLFAPQRLVPLLALQVVYKAIWLAAFILPLWRSGNAAATPWGVAGSFLFIVAVWPAFIWWAWRTAISA